MKIVMERSCIMKNWPKVMKLVCFLPALKLSIDVESLHFQCFPMVMKNYEMIMEKSWKSHGKIFCQVCGNPGTCSRISYP